MTKLWSNTTLDTVEALKRAPSVPKVREVFRNSLERHGFNWFLCSGTPRPESKHDPLLFEEWPTEWRNRYLERKYYLRDPMLHELYLTADPFAWSDVLRRRRIASGDRAIVGDAANWDMREGFVVPICGIGGQVHAVTMAGRAPRTDLHARAELHLVSIYAYARAKELRRRKPEPPIILRRRERDALQYAALGKTDWEIGRILGITEGAAHKRVETVKRRLGVHTRMQAVVEAIRHGQLHL